MNGNGLRREYRNFTLAGLQDDPAFVMITVLPGSVTESYGTFKMTYILMKCRNIGYHREETKKDRI